MKSHDLNLSNWGCFCKKYLGANHIADKKRGVTFDFNMFPSLYPNDVINVACLCDSGVKIMKSSADSSHFLYRYELIWKDELYIDADYCADNDGNMNINFKIVNNTPNAHRVMLNNCASVKFPTENGNNLEIYEADNKEKWIDSQSYTDIVTTKTLACDGHKLGEFRVNGSVNGSMLSGLSLHDGDIVTYEFKKTYLDKIYVKYIAENDSDITLSVNDREYDVRLLKNKEFVCVDINGGFCDSLKVVFHTGHYMIDGFILGDNDIEFVKYTDKFVPEIICNGKKTVLKYEFGKYEITCDGADYELSECFGENITEMLNAYVHGNKENKIYGSGKGHFVNFAVNPILADANSEKTVSFLIKSGKPNIDVNNEFSSISVNDEGSRYKLSQDIMSANTLANVVFPIYCKGEYIRHYTPGRMWDSLYTWDSGFIGMGLCAINIDRAKECLNTYTTEVGDVHSPFIFHGSVVPTQMLLYSEIWSSTTDMDFLSNVYPSMLKYYNFFSDICRKAGFGKTWHIFYNSGGWDDYPPQKHVHENKLTGSVYPVITTAITVLCAKIMKNIAAKLGESTEKFEQDIKILSDNINKYMWDEETGYYGYIKFDGQNAQLLKYKDEINYDMGFDGIYPYIAGICSHDKEKRIHENILNGLMTAAGVGVVDTRAPYYNKHGYWNGTVWMPHQWILWKALLDRGEIETATKIATTALEVWKKEVDSSYNCYEHFSSENCKGGGFHQFSGLSTPVLMWYKSFFVPGTVTVGFETMIDNLTYNEKGINCDILATTDRSVMVVCMPEQNEYGFKLDSEEVSPIRLTKGTYCIPIKCGHLTSFIK